VASLGANVAAGQGTAGLQTATNIGNLQTQAGRAQAAGFTGQAGAVTGGIENIFAGAGAFPNLFGGGQQQLTPAQVQQTSAGFIPGAGINTSAFGT